MTGEADTESDDDDGDDDCKKSSMDEVGFQGLTSGQRFFTNLPFQSARSECSSGHLLPSSGKNSLKLKMQNWSLNQVLC